MATSTVILRYGRVGGNKLEEKTTQVVCRNRLTRDVVDAPSLETLKVRLNHILSTSIKQ